MTATMALLKKDQISTRHFVLGLGGEEFVSRNVALREAAMLQSIEAMPEAWDENRPPKATGGVR